MSPILSSLGIQHPIIQASWQAPQRLRLPQRSVKLAARVRSMAATELMALLIEEYAGAC